MYRQGTKFYADWFDIEGVRHRKSFSDEDSALAHEYLQSAIKFAIHAGRHALAVEFWEMIDTIRQPLDALTDAAGWEAFTEDEISDCVDACLGLRRRRNAASFGDDRRLARRRQILAVILSGSLGKGAENSLGARSVPQRQE